MDFKNEVDLILKGKNNDKLWELLRLLKKLPDEVAYLIESSINYSSSETKAETTKYIDLKIEDTLSTIDSLASKLPEIKQEIKTIKEEIYKAIEASKTKVKDGYTPVKGKDYFDGKDGYTPIKGKDYFDGEPGYSPRKGIDYFDGNNGSPDSPLEIVTKLNTTKESVNIDVIKGLKNEVENIRLEARRSNKRGGGGANNWGEIQGTISNQTDLQSALDAKLGETFESISKNLKSYPYAFNKTGDVLDSITYTLPSGTITKTFNRTGTVLNTVVLSGNTPAGIDLTKTFNYTGSVLTSVTYS